MSNVNTFKQTLSGALRRNDYPGRFIAIEGLDGSGKTNQLNLLSDYFTKQGFDVYGFHWMRKEGSLFTDIIKGYLSGKLHIPKAAMQYIFSADYVIYSEEQIIPALQAGKMVIADRTHFWSGVAYGTWENNGAFDEQVARSLLIAHGVTTNAYQFILPDVTFYLDVSVDTAMDRLAKKKGRDIYEKRQVLDEVKKGYEWLLTELPEEFTRIDAERPIDQVTKDVIKHVEEKYGGKI